MLGYIADALAPKLAEHKKKRMNGPTNRNPNIRQAVAYLAIASAIVCATGCGGSGGGEPAVLREVIVFTRGGVLHRVEADGSGLKSLNNQAGRLAKGSPDGTRIIFAQGDQVATVRPDGTDLQVLTSEGINWYPEYSPDMSKIAFASNRDGDWELYVMNADGSNETRITNRVGEDSMPNWSPDGSTIYYMYSTNDDIKIWRIDPDGNNPSAVSTGTGYDAYPTVNTAGTKILFARNAGASGEQELFTMDTNGANLVELANGSASQAEFAPEWSADGSKVVYFGRPASGPDQIRMCDSDGANDHVLLPTGVSNDEFPVFATLYVKP